MNFSFERSFGKHFGHELNAEWLRINRPAKLNMIVGKVSFEEAKLKANIDVVLDAVGHGKIVKATLSSSMGPGIKVAV